MKRGAEKQPTQKAPSAEDSHIIFVFGLRTIKSRGTKRVQKKPKVTLTPDKVDEEEPLTTQSICQVRTNSKTPPKAATTKPKRVDAKKGEAADVTPPTSQSSRLAKASGSDPSTPKKKMTILREGDSDNTSLLGRIDLWKRPQNLGSKKTPRKRFKAPRLEDAFNVWEAIIKPQQSNLQLLEDAFGVSQAYQPAEKTMSQLIDIFQELTPISATRRMPVVASKRRFPRIPRRHLSKVLTQFVGAIDLPATLEPLEYFSRHLPDPDCELFPNIMKYQEFMEEEVMKEFFSPMKALQSVLIIHYARPLATYIEFWHPKLLYYTAVLHSDDDAHGDEDDDTEDEYEVAANDDGKEWWPMLYYPAIHPQGKDGHFAFRSKEEFELIKWHLPEAVRELRETIARNRKRLEQESEWLLFYLQKAFSPYKSLLLQVGSTAMEPDATDFNNMDFDNNNNTEFDQMDFDDGGHEEDNDSVGNDSLYNYDDTPTAGQRFFLLHEAMGVDGNSVQGSDVTISADECSVHGGVEDNGEGIGGGIQDVTNQGTEGELMADSITAAMKNLFLNELPNPNLELLNYRIPIFTTFRYFDRNPTAAQVCLESRRVTSVYYKVLFATASGYERLFDPENDVITTLQPFQWPVGFTTEFSDANLRIPNITIKGWPRGDVDMGNTTGNVGAVCGEMDNDADDGPNEDMMHYDSDEDADGDAEDAEYAEKIEDADEEMEE
ncbi:hypothetical protein G7Y89_g6810 [Cudoniella acicularis]|uniref:Uncharacterized protein n=1 Tax=Cudoniella acicularis TaxID=354080 RepID=A0A8H4W2I4_9HELO|nr:hypothetical protein G7Y89_g6810 [Cudoniella acicularis]